MWTFMANTHVKIWKNAAVGVFPPVGLPFYDGPGQLVLPRSITNSNVVQGWYLKLAVPFAAWPLGTPVLKVVGFPCYVQIIDDTLPTPVGWWIVTDESPSTRPDPANPGKYLVDNVFLSLIST